MGTCVKMLKKQLKNKHEIKPVQIFRRNQVSRSPEIPNWFGSYIICTLLNLKYSLSSRKHGRAPQLKGLDNAFWISLGCLGSWGHGSHRMEPFFPLFSLFFHICIKSPHLLQLFKENASTLSYCKAPENVLWRTRTPAFPSARGREDNDRVLTFSLNRSFNTMNQYYQGSADLHVSTTIAYLFTSQDRTWRRSTADSALWSCIRSGPSAVRRKLRKLWGGRRRDSGGGECPGLMNDEHDGGGMIKE